MLPLEMDKRNLDHFLTAYMAILSNSLFWEKNYTEGVKCYDETM